MKKITTLIVGILLTVVLISATAIFTRVIYSEISPDLSTPDIIFFDCDGISMNTTSKEPNGIYDEQDVIRAIRSECPKAEITNIMKDGNYWQEDNGRKCFYDDKTKDCET